MRRLMIIQFVCIILFFTGCVENADGYEVQTGNKDELGCPIVATMGIEENTETAVIEKIKDISEKGQEVEKSVPDNVIVAYLTEGIEYIDEVIPAQYTDDLSLLENLKYENNTCAYQDGKVYYRRYHEDSYEDAALWGTYDSLPDREKEIVCMDADGKETVLFADKGYGDIYLLDDRFYMMEKVTDENGEICRRLYSVDMQGDDRIDYGYGCADGSVYAVDTERKILILKMWENDTVFYVMNYETGEKKPLLPGVTDHFRIYIKDYQDGWIYYEEYDPDNAVSKLRAVSVEGEQREIIAITSSRNQNEIGYRESILDLKVDENRIYFIFGGYDGSAVAFQGGMLISVKQDGTDYKAVYVEDDDFYLSHDKGRSFVYFSRYSKDSLRGESSEEYDMLVWDVETDRCCYSGFSRKILFSYARRISSMWPYDPVSGGVLCGVTAYESESENDKTDVYAIPDDSGVIVRVVTDIEKYVTKWEKEEVERIIYEDFYFADGALYFKAEYSAYDKGTSIGWRDGYRRLHTDIYRLKLGESEADILYSY